MKVFLWRALKTLAVECSVKTMSFTSVSLKISSWLQLFLQNVIEYPVPKFWRRVKESFRFCRDKKRIVEYSHSKKATFVFRLLPFSHFSLSIRSSLLFSCSAWSVSASSFSASSSLGLRSSSMSSSTKTYTNDK